MTWPFADLQPLSYDVLLIDPATRFETWSTAGRPLIEHKIAFMEKSK